MKKTRISALHSQSDGQVQRQHQIILSYLAKFISTNQKGWDRFHYICWRTDHPNTKFWNDSSGYLFCPRSSSTDLLRDKSPKTEEIGSPADYLEKVKS